MSKSEWVNDFDIGDMLLYIYIYIKWHVSYIPKKYEKMRICDLTKTITNHFLQEFKILNNLSMQGSSNNRLELL
jgi:hypothetical protein